ncbi:efflux RND transporter periplasmic adaptor subunit [Qipengyuania qiaonensis]|uniref:Efflux RND transporter periplasmic adaptor subunit n=1 Tax=Qipengyuania qiaonensis TaxID=2867240 RepID=A0ABS7J7R1_9SPHN|nr:efflux RND transporter periplasmic adaptor subunit [Qipengyuania qiaonensis]MBX7481663.1 efflux RND transporter periplasmic adaptor subunit [Qipengyuania qiaonensis]
MRALVLLPLLLALYACADANEAQSPAPMVRVFTVGSDGGSSAIGSDTLTGTVAARIESTLSFREGGRMLERRVDNGASVRAGQLLARIDPGDLAAASDAARAQAVAAARAVDAAEASAERTAADVRRLDGLVEAGAISRSDYDAAVEAERAAAARLASARADAAAAGANARLSGNRRGYAELRADGNGVVTAILAEPGQVVAPGTPVLRLARSGPREVVVDVPEQQRGALPRSATGRLYGGGTFQLELRELAAAADPATRTYRARYRIVGASPPLGATVTLTLSRPDSDAAVSVPIAAVTERGGGPGVWIIGRNAAVAWKPVTVRAMDGEHAAVAGLPRGSRIVALGAHLLQPGQTVRVAARRPAAAR